MNMPLYSDPPPTTAEEAIALLHATELLRMKERDAAAEKLTAAQFTAAARLETILNLEKANVELLQRLAERTEAHMKVDGERLARIAELEKMLSSAIHP